MQLFAFGDSITLGSHVPIGWADQLRTHLFDQDRSESYPRMYNLGINGESSEGLIKRFEPETRARLREKYGQCVFFFAFGTNDVAKTGDPAVYAVGIKKYEENMRAMLEKAKQHTPYIVLLASPPVVEGLPNPNAKTRLNTDIEAYNAVLETLANELEVDFLDIYSHFEQRGAGLLLCADGIHPNESGHSVIFNLAKNYLESL